MARIRNMSFLKNLGPMIMHRGKVKTKVVPRHWST